MMIANTGISETHSVSSYDTNLLYAQLKQKIMKAGIYKRDYRFYILLGLFALSGFFVSGYFLFTLTNIPLLIITCIFFSFFTVQIAGIVHDAGHRAVLKTPFANDVLGYILGFLLAWGFSSWKITHNKHHAYTNQLEMDPDLDIPVFTFTKEQFKGRPAIEKFLIKYQVYMYYPFGSLAAFSTRVLALKDVIFRFKKKYVIEIFAILVGFFIWYALPFILFDVLKALIIVAVTNIITGFYLFNIFAPNHKGMPQIEKGKMIPFMDQQIMTSRDIRGNWFIDLIYLGLNYQVEHHLFPSVPRNKLKLTTPFIREICKLKRLELTTVGVVESNRIILSELKKITTATTGLNTNTI